MAWKPLACLVALMFACTLADADPNPSVISNILIPLNPPPDIKIPSPDGRWVFFAHWRTNLDGYAWQLEKSKTEKPYFAQSKLPLSDEMLSVRIGALWSADSRFLAINFYYGHIAYDFAVISTAGETPSDEVKWPRTGEASMIKLEDRALWDGDGVANSRATAWSAGDALSVEVSMQTELKQSSSSKMHIDSTREVTIQFSGLEGKVTEDGPPGY